VLSELVDREGSSHVLTVDMPSTDSQSSVRDAGIERDYAEHRAAVLGMLGADFPRLRDPEEIYQEAWAELLAVERRGEVVQHRRGLLKKIAWRRAADATKRRGPDAIDPSNPALIAATDDQPLPDEQAQLRLDGDALRLVVESLDERQAAALKLRFDQHLTAREVQDQLGISEKRLEAIITAAYKKIAAQLAVDDSGESRWIRRQRRLLLACELGIASSRQRRRAQAMVDRDPACRACCMRCGPTSATSPPFCRCPSWPKSTIASGRSRAPHGSAQPRSDGRPGERGPCVGRGCAVGRRRDDAAVLVLVPRARQDGRGVCVAPHAP
jgi:RNA polymerase sigma factor (sigma-70 family)